ncbi:MAG: kynureninase [Alphaproteobacteria bacterium]
MTQGAELPRKHLFDMPEGLIYLDGNSLGMLPKAVGARVAETIDREWGQSLIRAWNAEGWMDLPTQLGDRLGAMFLNAPAGSVSVGDTLSIKVYQALTAALKMRPDRRVILSDSNNFPSDLYMAQGLIETLGQGYRLETVPADDIETALTDEVAAVLLTEVDYRTGRRLDSAKITRAVHDVGAVMIWDLAHSLGAVPVDMAANPAEFAVGCTYKYLNAGPGAPAFIYIRPDLPDDVQPALAGWMGHANPFAMDPVYEPGPAAERFRIGTPPIVQMRMLEAALDVWEGVSMQALRDASLALSETFIAEVERRCPGLELASPRDPQRRGSQVSFHFDHGYAAMQALIAGGVIGDFRAPDIMRFGFTPLYLDEADVIAAVDVLERVIRDRLWDRPEFQTRSRVT